MIEVRDGVQQVQSPVEFHSTVEFKELPLIYVQQSRNSSLVSVLNVTRLRFLNTTPITVTNLTNPQDGQEVKILGDGYTTLDNNSFIHTFTGSPKLLAANTVYTFVYFFPVWYEDKAP